MLLVVVIIFFEIVVKMLVSFFCKEYERLGFKIFWSVCIFKGLVVDLIVGGFFLLVLVF